jgi:cell division transport system ATP-binding protein
MFDFHKNQAMNFRASVGPKLFGAENISVKFGQTQALKGIDFNLHQGEIVFLTGVSGAGKTTFLKTLGGFLEPTSGRVVRPNPRKVFTAPIFQDLKLFENQTCEQNLLSSFDPSVYKNRKEFDQDLMELARILGVNNRLDLKIKNANGGLKQKIAFMRALLTRPDVLLADEPTAALDFENARKMFDILNLYNVKQGLTVVWATHNKELAKKFTGRMVHMNKGKLIYSGHACFI